MTPCSPSPRMPGRAVARLRAVAVAGCLAAALVPATAAADALPVMLDGFFTDWVGPVDLVDPAGDGGGSGIDLREVDVANDDDWLFVRFQVTTLVGLQGSNSLVLYLDTDMNAGTGASVGGIGAELEWQFGNRTGTFHPSGTTISQNDIALRQLPSVTSTEFEIAIARNAVPDGSTPLFSGSSLRLLLRDESGGGDQAPDAGSTLTYTFDPTPMPGPSPLPLGRQVATDVRLVSWNARDLANGTQFDPGTTPSADRVLSALDPDVICFQELYDVTASQTQALVESFLPSGPGEAWFAAKNNDVVVVSRYAILGSWNLDGNLAVHLDATAALGHEVLLVGAHLPCCSNDTGRQDEIDHILSFLRDAMTPGGTLDVPNGTAFWITGDLNLVGDAQQLTSLLTGDIVDEGTWGPDFAPDWDGSGLADAVPPQTEARFAYTWRNDFSSFAPGRLDFILFSDSVAELGNHFAIYTPEMSAGELAAAGMQADDVPTVSDHLPILADFRDATATDVGPTAGNGGAPARILASAPEPGRVRFAVELREPAALGVEIYDVRGRRLAVLRRLADGVVPASRVVFSWNGLSAGGGRVASGTYVVRARVQGSGSSAAVARKVLLLR